MDVASDGISSARVQTLRKLKEQREQRALGEWQARERERQLAAAAEADALDELRQAREARTRYEADFHLSLQASDAVHVSDVERRSLQLDILSETIGRKEKALDAAIEARRKTDEIAAEARALWARAAAVTRKWTLIETDVRKAQFMREESVSEIETEDDISLRHGTGQAGGGTDPGAR
ncbi:hypothetical protein [Terrihabitans sp. B22-R8]|uniref:hypothetical protein n=1 Tax=Terrihabitans sp. B22-R8 TaxID=3425128 RepID=UPI00403C247B